MKNWTNHVALVVEDSAVQCAHLVELVKSLSFGTVLEACDGVDDLRVLERRGTKSVYLVFTDLDMPVMDSIELIYHLTERQLTKNLIVTSACDPRLLEIIEKMRSDDAELHLLRMVVKPVKLDDLVIALNRADQITRQRASKPDRLPFNFDEVETALEQERFIPFSSPRFQWFRGSSRASKRSPAGSTRNTGSCCHCISSRTSKVRH